MSCKFMDICGGCAYRQVDIASYRSKKFDKVKQVLSAINQPDIKWGNPVFIPDGTRRRASFAFQYRKGVLSLGFNENKSANIVDLDTCPLLTTRLSNNLPNLHTLLGEICRIPYQIKKGKKISQQNIWQGDVWVCDADNGLDIVLEYDAPLELEHRMVLFELAQSLPDIIRISHRRSLNGTLEPVIEKSKPIIKIGGYDVYIPAGTFLQASQAGESALVELVLKYLGDSQGNIADLFCGVGTFSYALANNINNKILAVDSSADLLAGFQQSINKNMLPNIKILTRNLFKYPLDKSELKNIDVVVFDPPRAGAEAQVRQLVECSVSKIIAVSCNPHSFVSDANVLISGGYHLQEVTFVDQFIYSNHSELVALFVKEQA